MKNIGVRVGRVTPAPNSALKDLKHTLPLVIYHVVIYARSRTAISQGRAPGDEHVKIITFHVKTRSPLTKDRHFKMAA